jgi:hypothetical protein
MQRLDLLARGQPLRAEGAAPVRQRARGARFGTLVSFGLGALMSSLLGGVTLIGLRSLEAHEVRMHALAPATLGETPPQTIDVAIERRERARAALSLRIEGADGPGTEVVLRGVPAEARLSKGERRDGETWVVGRANLDGLALTLGEAGPDTFDLRIDVIAPSNQARRAAVVHVRMVDTSAGKLSAVEKAPQSPPAEKEPDAAGDKAAPAETSVAKLATAISSDAGRTPPAGAKAARPPPERAGQEPAATKKAEARHWPEGASGLGAVSREPPERQLWWSMPPPDWSPFR